MTFIVRATRGEDATTAVRLRADTAVAKACDLAVAGWRVFIDCPDGNRHYPDDFDNLISISRDDSTLPSQDSERAMHPFSLGHGIRLLRGRG